MNFVLDVSVTLAWCFDDEGGDYALGVLDELRSSEAVAASHWGLELANAFLVAERRGRIERGDVSRLAKFVLALPSPSILRLVGGPSTRSTGSAGVMA